MPPHIPRERAFWILDVSIDFEAGVSKRIQKPFLDLPIDFEAGVSKRIQNPNDKKSKILKIMSNSGQTYLNVSKHMTLSKNQLS